jgi:hypothetical protein
VLARTSLAERLRASFESKCGLFSSYFVEEYFEDCESEEKINHRWTGNERFGGESSEAHHLSGGVRSLFSSNQRRVTGSERRTESVASSEGRSHSFSLRAELARRGVCQRGEHVSVDRSSSPTAPSVVSHRNLDDSRIVPVIFPSIQALFFK